MKGLTAAKKQALDKRARALVFGRDGRRCARCKGASHLQWSHVHTKRILRTRWLMENAKVLCAGCHRWWHDHPLLAAAWWEASYPERIEPLQNAYRDVVNERTAKDWSDYLALMEETGGLERDPFLMKTRDLLARRGPEKGTQKP